MAKLAPSILSADFANLQRDVQRILDAGADWVHVDVMDGHFVPNISLGACVYKGLKNKVDLVFDVHLMISDPLKYATDFIKAGADIVISDSVTHMWTAKGGVLDKVNEIKLKNPRMDNYRVWGEPEVSAEKQALIDVIRDHRCHVITTVRVKEKFDMQYNESKQKTRRYGKNHNTRTCRSVYRRAGSCCS